ncbi:hypothetical protein Scep_020861 [Stephania cephalantha]|uniref:RING-type E3 ubiquitin transferase n=1 Tax=Stephania cephalantha TaxID=152367 RepID=A0AAP0F504_9MAGN
MWAQFLLEVLSEMGWTGKAHLRKMSQCYPFKDGEPTQNQCCSCCCHSYGKDAQISFFGAPPKPSYFIHNQNRPDKAFTTERAKKAGKANACSGKIFVTVPPDHFGPILAENDPERKQGVLVGECWEDRMECRQWGAHLPHVAGIAGQSDYGAQSVALSGGYEDDEDHGEWFLYTGSGGRDLSGNKRTNKEQSFDQKFEKYNEALRVSCRKGYPVRVVRSHKEKRSSYAPESGVRYDGVYRIEKCWRKSGIQGFKVCRYLFVRCDNEPAPWTSDEHGDCPRPFPVIQELKKATDITERKGSPAWDYDEEDGCWKWKLAPPLSRKTMDDGNPEDRKKERRARRQDQNLSVREKLLKEFSCLICRKVMTLPLTTPCAHNFCKPCLEGAFSGQSFIRERHCEGRRTLRTQKNIMKCPSCPADISDFLQNPQVNRELMGVIVSLQEKAENNVEANDENLEESNEEESNSSKEKLDAVDEVDEIAIEKNEDLDFVVKDVIEDVIEGKANQTNQQKKCDAMNDKPLPAQCAESKDARVSSEIPDSGKDIRPTTKKSYKQKKVDEQHEKSTTKKPQALCKETKDASLKIPDSGEEGMQPTMRKTRNQKKADENHEMSPAKMSHASSTEIKDVTVSSDEILNSSKVDAKTTANKTRKRKKDSEVDPLPTPGRRVTRSMAQKTLN